jgi:hypothetical protein
VIRARELGQEGFVSYLKALRRIGVVDDEEALAWLRLHGWALRASGIPLDEDEGSLDDLAAELEGDE